MSFNTIASYVCLNHCHGLWRTAVTWFTLAIKTCLKTCLPRVNLRQITLLRDYTHPKEQTIVTAVLALHTDDFTFNAHV